METYLLLFRRRRLEQYLDAAAAWEGGGVNHVSSKSRPGDDNYGGDHAGHLGAAAAGGGAEAWGGHAPAPPGYSGESDGLALCRAPTCCGPVSPVRACYGTHI